MAHFLADFFVVSASSMCLMENAIMALISKIFLCHFINSVCCKFDFIGNTHREAQCLIEVSSKAGMYVVVNYCP